MTKNIASSVRAIEVEAERILADARAEADDILLKGKKEARQIIAAELPLDEVKASCKEVTQRATEEANTELARLEKKASEISADASEKVDRLADDIVRIVTGAKSA
jgi:F0F1-type ATP synthase membrane subunit b/b'